MFTRNMYMLMRSVLASSGAAKGILPMTTVTGVPVFMFNQFPKFPYSRNEAFTLNWNAEGISVGRGTSPTNELDWNLHSHISSGITGSVTTTSIYDDNGDPCLKHSLTITNTSSSDITIGEICYKQTVQVTTISGSGSSAAKVVMLDRTQVDPVITLGQGEATVIDYVIKSYLGGKTVNDVKIVSWQYGSDSDVAAMIDAARNGLINLRTDGGWSVGDMRRVPIGSTAVDLVITSFDEYNDCGNLMQLDFFEALPTTGRMNSSDSNYGGYGTSEMCTVTLPALADSMPEWLRNRMLTFDVLVSVGGNTSTIETVSGNKLALRSEVEVFNSYDGSYTGEGSVVPWFTRDTATNDLRKKMQGRGGNNIGWWLRSPQSGNTKNFRAVSNSGTVGSYAANKADVGIAPFLCI